MLLYTLEKYYVSDTGLRNAVLRISSREDISRQIENIVYLELLRRGYEVAVSKYGHKEVDLTARRVDEIQYIQVTMSMLGEDTYGHEIAPFRLISDNYAKTILSLDTFTTDLHDVCTTSTFWNGFLMRNDRYRYDILEFSRTESYERERISKQISGSALYRYRWIPVKIAIIHYEHPSPFGEG